MDETIDKLNIFYSWQSDLPNKTNRSAIGSAIKKAKTSIEQTIPNLNIVIDEATRETPGSPNIPLTILDKINTADIFICDITTINQKCSDKSRSTPNPNVVYELGYAVAKLGWNRIVMLFNTEYGNLSEDLPFDFKSHRVSPFKLSKEDVNNKTDKLRLNNITMVAIEEIIKQKPSRPHEIVQDASEEIKYTRDIENIRWALNTIHFPTLDEMINDLPRYIRSKCFYFWESYNEIILNSLFHLYDDELHKSFIEFHKLWEICVSHGEQYHQASDPKLHVFSSPMDNPLSDKQQEIWDKIDQARKMLKQLVYELLKIIREKYIDIDIDKTNENAWLEYVEYQNRIGSDI